MPQKESLKAVIKRKKKSISHDDRQGGKNYLFMIAINEYAHYNKLNNAVEDAKVIEEVLETRYVFDEILTLHDAEATSKKYWRLSYTIVRAILNGKSLKIAIDNQAVRV